MEKTKKVKRGTGRISHNRRHDDSGFGLPLELPEVGAKGGLETETPANGHHQNLTVDEIEVKVAMQILRQLELMDLQQLIDTLDFINSRQEQAAREDEPLDLADLEMEEVPS